MTIDVVICVILIIDRGLSECQNVTDFFSFYKNK